MSVVLKLEGFDRLFKALDKLSALAKSKAILGALAGNVKSGVQAYPKASPQGGRTWYERGFGPKWRSLPENRRQKAGLVKRVKGKLGMRGGIVYGSDWAGYQTSEQLQQAWNTEVGDTWAAVGTKVSYARAVQDKEQQAAFHRERGWPTLQDVGEREAEKALDLIEAEVDRILAGI